jgi:hypothetical protein
MCAPHYKILILSDNSHSTALTLFIGRAMAQAVSRRSPRGGLGSIPGQSMWWTKWHWDRFFPEYFGFPLSISFHRCSITWKNEKTDHLSLHLYYRAGQ